MQAAHRLTAPFMRLCHERTGFGQLETAKVVAQLERFFEGSGVDRAASSQRQELRGSIAIRGGTRLVEMMREHRYVTVQRRRAELLDGIGGFQMQPLPPRERHAA